MPTQKQLKTTQKVGGKAPTTSAKAQAKTQGGKAPVSSAKTPAKTQGGTDENRMVGGMPTKESILNAVNDIVGRFKDGNIIRNYLIKMLWNLGTELVEPFSVVFMNKKIFDTFLKIDDDMIGRVINRFKNINDKRIEFQLMYDIIYMGTQEKREADVKTFVQKFNKIMLKVSLNDILKFSKNINIFKTDSNGPVSIINKHKENNTIQHIDTIEKIMKYIDHHVVKHGKNLKDGYKYYADIDSFLQSYIVDWIIRLMVKIFFYIKSADTLSGNMIIPIEWPGKNIKRYQQVNNYIDLLILNTFFDTSQDSSQTCDNTLKNAYLHPHIIDRIENKIKISIEALKIYKSIETDI